MAERRSTNLSRLSCAHEPVQPSNSDIFSDDFALEPFELPNGYHSAASDRDDSHDATSGIPRPSVSFSRSLESPAGSSRRIRLSQRSDGESSVLSRLDHGSLLSRPRSLTSVSDSENSASTQHRSLRTISTFGFPRAQSPYQGATGPSQPYGMYPQDINLTRTPSAATASTIRQPERSYSGPSGPTQPYGMYAQNTVPEDDAGVVAGLAPPIAAGFPGSDQNFQRRLGPNGEDVDDLIGPDGYTEQLPPYSRYANGVPPKYSSGIGSVNRRNAPSPPVEDSQETLNSPESRDDALVNPFGDSSTQLSSAASDVVPPKDEGGNFKERVRRRSKKKVCCGISCWLCAVITIILFAAILLGGVIGGVVAHKRGEEKGKEDALAAQPVTVAQPVTAVTAAPTATVTQIGPPPDAISLSSPPSNLPPLPTGTYAVTLDNPTTATNSCLIISDQTSAWDCATGAQLSMNVSMVGPHASVVSLSYPQSPNAPIRYGAQPPELNGETNLMLYKDRDAFNKGAAYFFWQQYNKTVIVHNSDLPGGLPGSKRSFLRRRLSNEGHEDPTNLSERDTYNMDSQWPSNSIAQPADKPWYCYWPQTILEGFIFVYEDADENSSATAAATSAVSFRPPPEKRQATANLQPYPKVVKIEERRNPQSSIQPYCQQMQILNNNQPGPLRDPVTQEFIQVQLTENEPLIQHQMGQNQEPPTGPPTNAASPTGTGAPGRRRAVDKRARTGNGPLCQCEWMSN